MTDSNATDPLDRQPGLRQESQDTDGQMPGKVSLPTSTGIIAEEPAPTRVRPPLIALARSTLTYYSFMSDKIMPLSQAVEGYDIFDKAQAQKVVFDASK